MTVFCRCCCTIIEHWVAWTLYSCYVRALVLSDWQYTCAQYCSMLYIQLWLMYCEKLKKGRKRSIIESPQLARLSLSLPRTYIILLVVASSSSSVTHIICVCVCVWVCLTAYYAVKHTHTQTHTHIHTFLDLPFLSPPLPPSTLNRMCHDKKMHSETFLVHNHP